MTKKALFILTGFLFLVFAAPVVASSGFFEGFNHLVFKQPGDPQRPGLWLINDGDVHGGTPQYYQPCGDSSCIKSKHQGPIEYMSSEMYHDSTPGNYVNMEASELQSGFAYGQGYENTHPIPGHPVTVSAKMRCSGCNLDGTGGQVGSWGLWEWNSYPELQPSGSFTFHPATALGFGWVQSGGLLPGGLSMEIFQNNIPLFFQPVVVPGGINLRDWHTYKFVWSRSVAGTDTVKFYIDGDLLGTAPLPVAMPDLSETFWHDNEVPVGIDAFGNYVLDFKNPDTTQKVDVDFISVVK
jgi:hypothetical protein